MKRCECGQDHDLLGAAPKDGPLCQARREVARLREEVRSLRFELWRTIYGGVESGPHGYECGALGHLHVIRNDIAQILRWRNDRTRQPEKVENPTLHEQWAASALKRGNELHKWLVERGKAVEGAGSEPPDLTDTVPGIVPQSPEARALEFIDMVGEIQTAEHWRRWRWKHVKALAALLEELPEGQVRSKLVAIAQAKGAEFGREDRS